MPTSSLQTAKPTSILDMTLNCIWWWDTSPLSFYIACTSENYLRHKEAISLHDMKFFFHTQLTLFGSVIISKFSLSFNFWFFIIYFFMLTNVFRQYCIICILFTSEWSFVIIVSFLPQSLSQSYVDWVWSIIIFLWLLGKLHFSINHLFSKQHLFVLQLYWCFLSLIKKNLL